MTLLSRLLAFFPTLVIGLSGISFVWLCLADSWLTGMLRFGICLFVIYGLPVVVYRFHTWFYPISEGISYLQGEQYSPWWGSHQIQAIYIAFPTLETVLRLIPGMFSAWLRLWGAEIGQHVYWTPALEIADRGLLSIGDGVVIGHRVGLYAHVIKPKRQDLMLYVKPIQIGAGAFVGAGSHLGPGVVVEAGGYLSAGSDVYPNRTGGKGFVEVGDELL
ncbi:MAG: acyl transferase [Cyanobacteria bacterium P01_D01_bin.44]